MENNSIEKLSDLNQLRTSPDLTNQQSKNLLKELGSVMKTAQWFTVGIMAPSSEKAISVLRRIESTFSWKSMNLIENPNEDGPVFLKANQSSEEIRIRIEHGLGEGILITGHNSDSSKPSHTWGPFPLQIFDQTKST